MIKKKVLLSFALILIIHLAACAQQFGSFRSNVIYKPEEYTHVYEAKEKVILKAIAGILEEKRIGKDVSIDFKNHWVDSDYVVSDDWRTKANARVKQLNWKECEVTLVVTTEKKTQTGWEIRSLLGKEQYDNLFSVIDLKIYEEMSKIE